MSKQEFMDGLRAALAGRMGASLIAENVNYYDDYINTQVRMGRGEADVVRELGDPRLIAKSIIEANKHAGIGKDDETSYQDAGNGYAGYNYAGNRDTNSRYSTGYTGYGNEGNYRKKSFKIPGWLIVALIILVIFLVMSLAFSVLSFFMPIILPLLLVGMVVKFFRST